MPKTVHRWFHTMCLAAMAASSLIAQQQPGSQQRVVELFQQAQQAGQVNDDAKAAVLYHKILAIDPNIAEVWSNLGMALYHLRDNGGALTAFEKAQTLKPALLAPHLFEGKVLLDLGDAQKALVPLKAALLLSPNETETMLALGDAYASTHQYASAVSMLRKAAKQTPDSEDIGCRLAVTYLEWAATTGIKMRASGSPYGRLVTDEKLVTEHPELAEEAFRKTLDANPNLLEARLGFAYFLMSDRLSPKSLEASADLIDEASRSLPRNPDVIAASARLGVARGDFSRASERLNELIKIDPAFALANLDTLTAGLPLQMVQSISGQLNQVSSDLAAASESYSSQMSALQHVRSRRQLTSTEAAEFASAAWHLHRYDEAMSELSLQIHLTDAGEYWLLHTCAELGRQVLTATVDAHPQSVRSHLLLADLALQQDKNATARTEYETAIALRPDDPEIRLLYLRVLESAGDKDQAIEEAKRDASKFPENAGLSCEAGDLLLHLNSDPSGALPYLKHSIELDPKPEKPHIDLVDAYAELDQLDDAIREIGPVLGMDEDGTKHYRLAQWYRRSGRPAEAEKALATFMKLRAEKQKKDSEAAAKAVTLR